jgi:hypothetical protein
MFRLFSKGAGRPVRTALRNREAYYLPWRASGGSCSQWPWYHPPTNTSSRYHSSTQQTDVAGGSEHNRPKNPTTAAATFLRKVERNQVPKSLICQRVEELLIQMLTRKLSPTEGPISLELLNVAIANANLPNERLIPRLFSLACQVMVGSGHPLALNEVIRQLWRLLDNQADFLTNDLPYNSHHVNDACAQYINGAVLESKRKKDKLSRERQIHIEKLMKRLGELYDDPSVPLVANIDSCNAFVMFLCNQGRPKEAYQQLKWMVDTSLDHPVEILPRVSSFTATISAFARTEPETSFEILQWMLDLHRTGSGNVPAPNTSCFNGLLDAWAKSGRKDAGEKTEQTLEWMQQLHDTEGLDTAPDEVSFNCCINAWANSPIPNAANHAESILRRMITMYENGSDVVPSNFSFNSAMNAWANSGARDAPDRVSNLLDLHTSMAKESSTSLEVNSYSYAIVLKAWENVGTDGDKRRSDNYVLKILDALDQMERDRIEKTPAIHNSAIMAISKFSMLSAILYFQEVEESYRNGKAAMDVRTFNSGLSIMASLNKPDIAERSTDILDRMVQYSKADPSVKPNHTTSNVILKILSRSPSPSAAKKADELLRDMEAQRSFETSQASYVTVIIAWGRSDDECKFDRVQELLKRYHRSVKAGAITNSSSPNVYNAALSVCQHNADDEKTRPKALETALYALSELRNVKSVKPDEKTYLTMFRAMNRLQEENLTERRETLDREFALCIKEGLVSRSILEALRDASPESFEQIFGPEGTPETVDIPHNWSKRSKRSPPANYR